MKSDVVNSNLATLSPNLLEKKIKLVFVKVPFSSLVAVEFECTRSHVAVRYSGECSVQSVADDGITLKTLFLFHFLSFFFIHFFSLSPEVNVTSVLSVGTFQAQPQRFLAVCCLVPAPVRVARTFSSIARAPTRKKPVPTYEIVKAFETKKKKEKKKKKKKKE